MAETGIRGGQTDATQAWPDLLGAGSTVRWAGRYASIWGAMVHVDYGIVKLTQRDLQTLVWISDQWSVCVDHLQAVLAHSSEMAVPPRSIGAIRETVARWRRAGGSGTRRFFSTNQAGCG